MQEGSLVERLKAFMELKQLSQQDVAKAAQISQSTVSRALSGQIERLGRAKAKLFTYMQDELEADASRGVGKEKVVNAFTFVWDGSDEHATAIARIIKASKGLRPEKLSGGDNAE